MSFSKVYRLIPIVLLFFAGGFCSAQDEKHQADDDSKTYIEQSKTIAVFYKLLNQEKAPTVKEAFLIFHPEMEWSVAYTEYADDQAKALKHINSPEETQESLLFKKLRQMKDQLQYGEHKPNTSPQMSFIPVKEKNNAIKAVFLRQEKALEIEFVFPIHPDHHNKVSNIYLENGESILKLIGAK